MNTTIRSVGCGAGSSSTTTATTTTNSANSARRWAAGLLVVVQLAGCLSFGAAPSGNRLARLERSPHFRDGHFHNRQQQTLVSTPGVAAAQSDFFFGDQVGRPPCPMPVAAVSTTTATWAAPPASGLRVTWLGHSTTVIEVDGLVVLTDPQFSDFAAPFDVGVERFQPPPIPLAQLPPIDVVVISHDHYDHLDQKTVQRIAAERPSTTFLVPLGIGSHLERWGIAADRFREFDWGDDVEVGGVRVVSTPSRHFSGRAVVDTNRTLWTSWALIGPRHRVWFSGDTGMTPLFTDIGRDYGPFDVALVEIGQWNAAWGSIHLGPHGALKAVKMVNARRLFPVHWGMFNLAVHDWSEPIETTVNDAAAAGVDVVSPQLGLPIEPDRAPPSTRGGSGERWWRTLPPIAGSCP